MSIYTARRIAHELNMNHSTVSNILCGNKNYADATIAKVLDFAKSVGYDAEIGKHYKAHRETAKKEKFWFGGNFHTKAEEIAHMNFLRDEGFTNAEIARKIGRSYGTVRCNIGLQPKSYTERSRIRACEIRHAKTVDRRMNSLKFAKLKAEIAEQQEANRIANQAAMDAAAAAAIAKEQAEIAKAKLEQLKMSL